MVSSGLGRKWKGRRRAARWVAACEAEGRAGPRRRRRTAGRGGWRVRGRLRRGVVVVFVRGKGHATTRNSAKHGSTEGEKIQGDSKEKMEEIKDV